MPADVDPVAVVRRFCRRHGLLRPGPLVVAVSGGADSVCLLHLLQALAPEYGLRLHVAHFQHGLRGAEADADAGYVATLADRLGLPASFGSAEVLAVARRRRRSLEATAHEVRWAFLEVVRARVGAGAVATGHTMDDQAETVLLHLLRGSGLRGLAGLAPRQGLVVRPLLGMRHVDTLAWCREQGVEWREDASNAEAWCRRNAIRLEVVPLLRQYNPALESALAGTAEALQADLHYLEQQAGAALTKLVRRGADGLERLDLAGYRALPEALRRHLLLAWLGELTERSHVLAVDALLEDGRAGGADALPGGRRLIRQYTDAVLAPGATLAAPAAVTLAVPGRTEAAGWDWEIKSELLPGPLPAPTERWAAQFDADRLELPLLLRSRRPGDRIKLPGLAGPKKLQDVLVDAKIPRWERERVGVIVAGNGIIWLAGRRIAAWAAATETSETVLRLTVVAIGRT